MTRLPTAARSAWTAARVLKLLALAVGAFAVGAGGTFGVLLAMHPRDGQSRWHSATQRLAETAVSPNLIFDTRDQLNIVLIGEDLQISQHGIISAKQDGRSDTNLLVHLDRVTNSVSVVSIPRDTKVRIPAQKPGHEIHKINAAHALGGAPLLMETVRTNFGVTLDHFVTTNFHGFIEMVDLIGGVDVEVERDMDYDDSWQDFHVHLKKGFQHLNGRQAQGYVRWRKGNKPGTGDPKGDLGRIERQQKVIKLIAAKVLSPAYIPQMPHIARAMLKYVKTDLSTRQLLSLVVFMRGVNPQSMATATLPGDYVSPYLVVRRTEAATVLRNAFGLGFDEAMLAAAPAGADKHADAAKSGERKPGKAVDLNQDREPPADEDPGDDHPVRHTKPGRKVESVGQGDDTPAEPAEPAEKPDKATRATKPDKPVKPLDEGDKPKLERVKPDRDEKPVKPVKPVDKVAPN